MSDETKPKRRFVPCPYCKGKRGNYEPIEGMWEAGPYYPCAACDGSGDMADYVRLEAARRAKYAREISVVCECKHAAAWHYEGYAACGCGWMSDSSLEGPIETCLCRLSREAVMSTTPAMRVSADEAAAELPNASPEGKS